MLSPLLYWLDASPLHYWLVAWASFAFVAGLAFADFFSSRERAWWQHPAIFALATLIALFAFRWPMIFDNRQYPDPDESQLIAGAMTLKEDPVFWRSVDGSTHGPLDEWPLLPILLARGGLDFTGARTASTLLAWIEVLSAWLIFRRLYSAKSAGLLALPLFAFHSFTHAWSFVAYCSEHVPDALLALGCWSLLTTWPRSGKGPPNLRRLFLSGIFLGALPFAKLQAVPIAAVAVLGGIFFALLNNSSSMRERFRAVGTLVGGAALLPAIILGLVLIFGIWADFLYSYILDNIRVGSAPSLPTAPRNVGQLNVSFAGGREFGWAETPEMLVQLGGSIFGFNEFFLWVLGFGGVGLLFIPWFRSWHRRCVAFAAAVLLIAVLAAMAPGRIFIHYLQLAIFPAALFGGLVAGALLSDVPRPMANSPRLIIVAVFVACGMAPQLFWRAQEPQPFLGRFTTTHGAIARSEASREILRHANSGEKLGVWGWTPRIWVETGLIPATRDGNDTRQRDPYRYRDYFRARFMRDLTNSKPPVFIDTTGPGNPIYIYRDRSGYETFSELREYIEKNYYPAGEFEASRIYVRNDR